jgi:YfiH family protein
MTAAPGTSLQASGPKLQFSYNVVMPPKSSGSVGPRDTKSKLRILKSDLLEFPWLVHGFSARKGGVSECYGGSALNLGFTKHDQRQAVEQNRSAFLKQLDGNDEWRLITIRQIHSDLVHEVNTSDAHPTGDGLITKTTRLLLGIQTADCLPILIADPKQRAVGAVHAGWRGTLARIAAKAVGEMQRAFGSLPGDLRIAIGPSIHACCYEVGEEVGERFHSQFAYAAELLREVRQIDPVREKYPLMFLSARPPGHGDEQPKFYLDLVAANIHQLVEADVLRENIAASPLCTSCRSDLLFSYRAEKGNTGRLLGAIGIRGE